MSVRKNEQTPSSFAVLDTILTLVTYVCSILTNEKIFIPRYQKLIDKMLEESCMIYHKCRVANKINMRIKDEIIYRENAQQRLRLERESLRLCEELMTDIMISQKVFHLKASKVRHWTKLTMDSQNAIEAWYKSEVRRYGL